MGVIKRFFSGENGSDGQDTIQHRKEIRIDDLARQFLERQDIDSTEEREMVECELIAKAVEAVRTYLGGGRSYLDSGRSFVNDLDEGLDDNYGNRREVCTVHRGLANTDFRLFVGEAQSPEGADHLPYYANLTIFPFNNEGGDNLEAHYDNLMRVVNHAFKSVKPTGKVIEH